MKNLIWFKNSIIDRESAHLSPMSASAQYGINVFEGLRAYKAKADALAIFRYQEHIERLQSSLAIFGNNDEVDSDGILQKIKLLVKANSFTDDIAIRLVLMNTNEVSWSSRNKLDFPSAVTCPMVPCFA